MKPFVAVLKLKIDIASYPKSTYHEEGHLQRRCEMKLFECRFNGKQYTVWFELSEGEDVMNGAGIHDILCSFGFPPKTHLDFGRGFHMRYTFPLGTTEERVKEVRNAVEALPLICF